MNTLDEIEARIRDCKTYNFGMRNADTLAHFDAPALLALVRSQQAQIERVRELHHGNRWGFCEACSEQEDIPMPCPTIAALTATEGA